MALGLANKRALVVGGQRGIGLAAARRFLEEGARVVIAGLSATDELKEVGDASFFPCDASNTEQVDGLFATAVSRLGGLDVLYHVAGISGRRLGDGPLHECTDAGWDGTLSANL